MSSTIFEFGDWAIEGYEHGWMVTRYTTIKSGAGEGQRTVDRRTYWTTMDGAFRALPDRILREHGAYGPVAAMKAVQELGAAYARELDKLLIKGRAA